MAVDSRQKRASAFYLLLPITHGAQSDTSGVDDEERWAATWMYNGIAVGAAVAVTDETLMGGGMADANVLLGGGWIH